MTVTPASIAKAQLRTGMYAFLCTSPHVSKGEKTGTQASLPASSAECGQECPRSFAQART
ncbi:MAG: hypothetical protein ACRD6X_09070 [Pyrinomonadaceae bacterium]